VPSPNVTTSATPARRPIPRELAKILADCRDLAVHRLLLSFTALLDRVCDMLMDRAGKSDVRDEQQLFLEARQVLLVDRATLMAEFEKRLRARIEDHVSGRADLKADFSKMDATKLALVDLTSIDESVIVGNIVRVVENVCHEELVTLNRGIGHLLGKSPLENAGNPLGPNTIVGAFAEALGTLKGEDRVKFQILKELNQAPLGEIAAIYGDVNRHLANLRIIPPGSVRRTTPRPPAAERKRPGEVRPDGAQPSPEMDMMGMFRRMASHGGFPLAGHPAPPMRVLPPLPPTPSGYVPGSPIVATPGLREGLTRLQAGQTDFAVEGMQVAFSGIPEGTHNVLRDLQESPLGQRANQLEAMTIEMVAMLFDFIFETRDLPDGIKALLARLQIPVLKVAMLDGAFFAKKTHPSRLLVTRWPRRVWAGRRRWVRTIRSIGRSTGSSTRSSTDSATTSGYSTSCAPSWTRSCPLRSRPPRRISPRPPRRSTRTTARTSPASSRSRKSSAASRATPFRTSSPNSCVANGRARSKASIYVKAKRATPGARASPRSRTSCGAYSRRRRRRIASTSSHCCRRC
jgi:hypothetical protein